MKYLEETTLIITDLITETIILFIALILILNYDISKDKEQNLCDTKSEEKSGASNSNDDDDDAWKSLKSIIEENVNIVIDVLKTCTNSFMSFPFYILLLYIYFYLIRPSKRISFPKYTFNTNSKFIFEDFGNKFAFIILFPILFISIISFIFVSIKLMFQHSKEDIFNKINIIFKILIFLWVGLLFYVLGHILYLFTWGNITRLIKNQDLVGWYSVMYFFSFILMTIIFFAGFYKLLLFILMSIFMLHPMDIKKKLKEKDTIPFYFIIQFALCFTLLMNIKQLFSFELWIFGIVIFILFFLLLAKAYYDNYNKTN